MLVRATGQLPQDGGNYLFTCLFIDVSLILNGNIKADHKVTWWGKLTRFSRLCVCTLQVLFDSAG
jgi:hypothetical protein